MDLYEEIEIVEAWVNRVEENPKKIAIIVAGDEVFESIKTCLEAARENTEVRDENN